MTSKSRGAVLAIAALALAVGGAARAALSDDAGSATRGPTVEAGETADAGLGAAEMDVVSLNQPAFASSGTASLGNDDDYDTAWTTLGPGWLAYDLSKVPDERRHSVIVAWFTSPDDGYTVKDIGGMCPAWSGRQYPSDFVIEANAASGGSPAPDSKWVKLATVRGSQNLSGQHLIDFGPYNWIRLSGSGPNGISINMDVVEAASSADHGWLFMGDSITAAYASHATIATSDGTRVRSLTDLVASRTDGHERFLVQNAGTSCAGSVNALKWIGPMVESFYGSFVTLNFGGADGYGGTADPEPYYEHMMALVDEVVKRGKVPVVPTIPWPNNGGDWQRGIEALNEQILRLYRERPEVVRGPDLYSLTKGRGDLYIAPGDVHPNSDGSARIRKAWSETMFRMLDGRP